MKRLALYTLVFCGTYLITSWVLDRIETPTPVVNINRIEAIGSPSGIPVIVYDPDRNRIMINTKNLPNGLDICIDGVCARDTHWRSE